jgi:integrase
LEQVINFHKYSKQYRTGSSDWKTLKFFWLGFNTGLRYVDLKLTTPAEMLELINADNFIILDTIKHGVKAPIFVTSILLELLNELKEFKIQMTNKGYNDGLKKLATRHTMPVHITSHISRHSFAQDYADEKVQRKELAVLMGHKKEVSVSPYIAPNLAHVAEAYKNRELRIQSKLE